MRRYVPRRGLLLPDYLDEFGALQQLPLYAAMTRTFLTSINSGVNATSYTSGSTSGPAVGAICLAATAATAAGSVPGNPTSVTGNGLTYTLVTSTSFVVTTIGVRLSLLRAMATSTPSTGVITVQYGAQATSCNATFNYIDGVDQSGTNGSGAIGNTTSTNNGGSSHSAGDLTTTLTYGNSNNRPYVAVSDNVNAAEWSALAGWTATGFAFENSPANVLATYWRSDLADTTVGATHATSTQVGLVAAELVAAASGTGAYIPESAFPSPMRGLGSGLGMAHRAMRAAPRRRFHSLGALHA